MRQPAWAEIIDSEHATITRLPGRPAELAPWPEGVSAACRAVFEPTIPALYRHQAEAIAAALAGQDVLVTSGTGSGKSLCFYAPIIERCLGEPMARSLIIAPTKALAYDQADKLQAFAGPAGLTVATFDGDTPKHHRAAIKRSASIVITNPDMLHVGILAGHETWIRFLRALRVVVVDELHAYRGIFGSHVAGILRRLQRLAEWHRATPQFLAGSATVANPVDLFCRLTGRAEPTFINEDGAAQGERTFLVCTDPENPHHLAADLFADFVANGERCLAFCRSRIATESLVLATRRILEERGDPPSWIDGYRSGYTATERRALERAFKSGKLRGLATTNALELGIDVGQLSSVIVNGFPGALASLWQQWGRAGRAGQEGLGVLVAHEDPLEQYLARNPTLIFDREVENVTINPDHPQVLADQISCAAAERALSPEEINAFSPDGQTAVDRLVEEGAIGYGAGRAFYQRHEHPARRVNIRSESDGNVILLQGSEVIGEMEAWRARRYAHPGAVYLHRGESYLVRSLDLALGSAQIEPIQVHYTTQPDVISFVEQTAILDQMKVAGHGIELCGVTVTCQVVSFRRIDRASGVLIDSTELDFDPEVKNTVGVRLTLPDQLDIECPEPEVVTITHGLEHAILAVAPLFAGCDRRDFGSAWYAVSPDRLRASVYLYDQTPGGIGLSEVVFSNWSKILAAATDLLATCSCEDGCPACLFASHCESANEHLSRRLALGRLSLLTAGLPGR